MFELLMPKLDETMENGVVVRWLKKEGDRIAQGEPLLEVETEKVILEVESPYSGALTSIVVAEGEKVTVGTVIAYIGE